MKRYQAFIMIISLSSVISFLSCNAQTSYREFPITKMQEQVGDSITTIIMNARSITAELQGASQNDSVLKNMKLNRKQRYVLRFMVANESNYESNDTVYGIIMPNVTYTVKHKKQKALIAVDFGLRKWQIQDEKGKPIIQFDVKDEGLLFLTHLLFPENDMINYYYNNKK